MPQTDAVPVYIATLLVDVSSIEPCLLQATSARSASYGAMDAVARMLKTIHSSQHGPMLHADACTPETAAFGHKRKSRFCSDELHRCATRQDELNRCALAVFAVEIDLAA
jgi:hypothetical protein